MLLHGYIENGSVSILEKEVLKTLNKKYEIEIIIKDFKVPEKKSAKGSLSKYMNIDLIEKEKDFWENSVRDSI